MSLMVGSHTNYGLLLRRLNLSGEERFEWGIRKITEFGKKFGFNPMGISLSVGRLPRTDRGYLDELKARLKENNLVAQVGIGRLELHNNREIYEASVKQAIKDLEIAAYMGSRTSITHTSLHGRMTREGLIKKCIAGFTEVGKAAKSLGIIITTENYVSFKADEYARIFEETGLDNVGLQIDTGNWLCNGEDPVVATQKMLPWIFATHVKDYVLENDAYTGVAVGSGLVDYERILPLLAKASEKEDLVLTVELDTDDRDEEEELNKSFAYLRDWLIRNGDTKYLIV